MPHAHEGKERKYEHISHTHCWNQVGNPACGIPMEKHTQCCLCDLKVPVEESKGTMEEKHRRHIIEEVKLCVRTYIRDKTLDPANYVNPRDIADLCQGFINKAVARHTEAVKEMVRNKVLEVKDDSREWLNGYASACAGIIDDLDGLTKK